MTTIIHLAYTPRQGILLNPSPSVSPYQHSSPLPLFVPSNTSLSSSSSSALNTDSEYCLGSSSSTSNSKEPSPALAVPRPLPAHSTTPHCSNTRSDSPAAASRRIRFAPLPDPRRDEEPFALPPAILDDSGSSSITESTVLNALGLGLRSPADDHKARSPRGDRSPRFSPSFFYDAKAPAASESTPTLASTATAASSCTLTTPHIPRPAHSPPASTDSSPPAPTVCPSGSASVPSSTPPSDTDGEWDALPPSRDAAAAAPRKAAHKWSKKLFKPLLGPLAKGAPCSGAGAGDEADAKAKAPSKRQRDRSGSRGRDTTPDWVKEFGMPLGRWQSDDVPRGPAPKKGHRGVEFGRTQSLDREEEELLEASLGRISSNHGGRRQQRMLNGRVYGAKRNPFANARPDPQFVEWGYGGMGSVQASNGHASIWSKVQSSGAINVGAHDSSQSWGSRPSTANGRLTGNGALGNSTNTSGAAKASASDDDGTGMAWVRKRREQRERERKEREERERKEKEAGAVAVLPGVGDVHMHGSESGPPSASVREGKEKEKVEQKEGHVYTAVTVPARAAHPRKDGRVVLDPPHGVQIIVTGESEELVRTASKESVGGAGAEGSAEDGSGEDEEESPRGEGEEEDEEEDEMEERSRLTALGAGVEKISRHKESASVASN